MLANSQLRTLTDLEIDQISGGEGNAGAILATAAAGVAVGALVAGTGGVALVAIGAAVLVGVIAKQS